jgi:hypothetical protein
MRVFENRVLTGICGTKRDEAVGDWRRLHNKELHDLYVSPSIIRMIKSRKMKWVDHVARMREMGSEYKRVAGKPEGKRTLGRPRRRWGMILE